MRQVALATPTYGTVYHLKVSIVFLGAKLYTKFEACSFSHSEDISWVQNSILGHVTLTTPLSAAFSCSNANTLI